jgi:Cu/Ag efflux protein CusF
MKHRKYRWTFMAALSAGMMVLASCTQEQQPAPTAARPRVQTSVTTQPGVAGGVVEDVFTAQAVVSAVDIPTRRVTLTGSEGGQFTFTAGPEIKNLPQVKVGDKVTATFARRMVVVVRSDEATPSLARSSTGATALPGAKPGMLVAEETQAVARVKAIDSVNRTADLEFSDGTVKTFPVRSDVDLSRYKAGDNVVIRVTTGLTVLVESP